MSLVDWIGLVTAIASVVTAVATSVMAVAGWKAMRNFIVYRRREKIFIATVSLIRKAVREAHVNRDDIRSFLIETDGATFLFRKDVKDYLDEVTAKAAALMCSNDKIEQDRLVEKCDMALIDENADTANWFCEQIIEVNEVFRKYLDLSHD